MSSVSRRTFLATGGALLAAPWLASAAASWPAKPVRIVVAFAPGGSLDLLARRIAAHMEAEFGMSFVVENRSGAGGRIGTQFVGQSPGDGYTLIATSSAAHGVAPSLYPDLGYRPMDDFTHIGLISKGPMGFIVRHDAPYDSAAELVAHVKTSGSPVFYGSGGIGSLGHLTGALIGQTLDIPMQHVSYRGSAPAQLDLLGGNLTAITDNLSSHSAQYRSGALKVIGLTASQRFPRLPDIATFAEQGYPQLEAAAWYGLSGGAGIPDEIVARLNAALKRFLTLPETVDLLAEMAMIADDGMPAAEYSAFVESEIERWGKVVREAGITVS